MSVYRFICFLLLHFVTCYKYVMTVQGFIPVRCLFIQAFRYHFFQGVFKSPCASMFLAAGFINNSWHKSGANNSFVRTAACHTTAAVLPCNFLLLVPSLQPQSPFIPRLLSVRSTFEDILWGLWEHDTVRTSILWTAWDKKIKLSLL